MKVKKSLIAVAVLSCGVLQSMAFDLIKDAKPIVRIYHAPLSQNDEWSGTKEFGKLSPSEMDTKSLAISISDLNYHFKEMGGTELEVVVTDDPKKVKAPAIVIGALANKMGAAPDVKDDPSKEAFCVKVVDNMVLIGGSSDFGASHGIYALLEKLGCAWVMPGKEGEIIPKMKTVSVPDLDIQEAPSFGLRNVYYGGRPSEQQWQELQLWGLRQKANIYGTKQRFGFSAGSHAWGFIIRKFKKEFEAHPEMMGLIRKSDGSMERGGGQLESTHPRCIELAIEFIRQTFKDNGWANDTAVCIGMGPNDGGALSLSPESVNAGVFRVNYDSGGLDGTDVVVLFLNTLLERTAQEFPNLRLGFMVYSWHGDYPMRYKPNPRIVVGIRDLNVSRYHGMSDLTSKSRAYYKDIVLQWGKLAKEQGNQVSHGDYSWNPAEAVMPYTRVKISGEDFPIYKQAGISIKSTNLGKDWYLTGAHNYVTIKMAWDVKNDWRKLLREYCENAFGAKAAPFMEKYYLELARRQSENSHETGSFFAIPLLYDKAFVSEQEKTFDDALSVAGTEMDKKRIRYARYPLKTLGHYLDMREAYAAFDFAKARTHFEKGTKCLEEITAQNVHFEGKSGKDYFNGFSKFLDAANKYSSGDYRIEYQIPNRLKTAIDVNNLGQNNRFWGSKIDDSNYLTTETYMSTWDAQGLSGFQQGSVWYRIHFKIDGSGRKDMGYGLFIGGADNRVAVWCNDKFIARSSAGLRTPTQFDITDAVQPGEDNLIVIQVTRHGIWELFTGGIMMPSFIFSGPRVEQPKDVEPSFRVLPGGVLEYIKQ
ncbi:MAG: hypothetical protein A2X49_04830 [Lentisphaerae bacterium GWF2_52_8]|nr:MAG: hypothetical protein A2X49_04830 [Lentisphaerae bacterium GWF2_52_8]